MPDEIAAADAAAIEHVRAAFADAAFRLAASGARTEALAEYVPPGRILLLPRAERLRPIGRVWRLGVLLLAADEGAVPDRRDGRSRSAAGVTGPLHHPPAVFATGSVTRSREPGRPTYQAASAERRRQLGVAAFRGRFPAGTTVDYDARPIALDASLVAASGPLTVRDGAAWVRWADSDPGALAPFDGYLADRVALLIDPPVGA